MCGRGRQCQVSVEPEPTAGERDKLLRGQPGMLSPLGGLWPGLFSPRHSRHSHWHGHSELRHFLFKKKKEESVISRHRDSPQRARQQIGGFLAAGPSGEWRERAGGISLFDNL